MTRYGPTIAGLSAFSGLALLLVYALALHVPGQPDTALADTVGLASIGLLVFSWAGLVLGMACQQPKD